jgi:hypothetical protein
MKANKNSISARLYRWFYFTDEMPSNLCPYFWKLVVAYTLILPLGILCTPILLDRAQKFFETEDWFQRIIGSALIWAALFLGFVAIFSPITLLIWGWFAEKTIFNTWQFVGLVTWGVVLVIALVSAIMYFISIRKKKKLKYSREFIWDEDGNWVPNPDYVPHVEKPNLLVEFIKAKYNKYCPKIDWE